MNYELFGNVVSSTDAYSRKYLTREEETALSKLILAGEEAKKELSENKTLQDDELTALAETVKNGEAAWEHLVLANSRRAMKFAADTRKKNPFGLNDIEDYYQAAMRVICVCARTFDWRKKCRFSTFVHLCLQNEMLRENARTGYALRIPEHSLNQLSSLKKNAETMNMADAAADAGMTQDAAEKLLLMCKTGKSLQAPLDAEEPDTEFGDMLPDPYAVTSEDIEDRIELEEKLARLALAFCFLSEDEKTLLRGRMGFDGTVLPMRAFVGTIAESVSGVQKKQLAAQKHLREIYESLPLAG